MAGASVTIGTLTAETDDGGEFDFHEIEVGEEHDDRYPRWYSPAVSRSAPRRSRPTTCASPCRRQRAVCSTRAGRHVESESGVVLKLKPGQMVDETASGHGAGRAARVAINDRDEMAAAPGGMMALDPDASEDNPPTQLESFGMMEIEHDRRRQAGEAQGRHRHRGGIADGAASPLRAGREGRPLGTSTKTKRSGRTKAKARSPPRTR